MTQKEQAIKELAIRKLEENHKEQQESLWEFVQYFWEKEKKKKLDPNWHIIEMCSLLEDVFYGNIKRLIINIPPRSLKTEIVSIAFPAWCIGKDSSYKNLAISYSAGLAEKNSGSCRNMYTSNTYSMVFPRKKPLKSDLNTKKHWENIDGGQYYASGSDGTITGVGADCIIIDDPLKPTEADSDTMRTKVNNNYHDTIESRLNDKSKGAIIIIMQRLHDDDLCGHLIDLEEKGMGDEWHKFIVPAVAEVDDEHRKAGESFFPKRFPLKILNIFKKQSPMVYSCQYQQNPVNKETQEFHEERFRYHGDGTNKETPKGLRIFTAVDPAFKTAQHNDNSSIITGGFIGDKLYILEYTVGKFQAHTLQDKIVYHIKKWNPEKTGIESYQAQTMIAQALKLEMEKQGIYTSIEEITQAGDKLTKIRKLVPLYRNGLIYHKLNMSELEGELKRFPRGKHDDIVDSLQMLYDMYTLQPNSASNKEIGIEYDRNGVPVVVNAFYDDDFSLNA